MLESISIKNVATYDEVGVELTSLKKINFIYGTNGSGKTTISKLLNDPLSAVFAYCNLKWKGNFPIKTLVYNKEFRERNFGKGKIEGVFTLGEATKEEIEAIDKMQIELQSIKENCISKKETFNKQKQKKQEKEDEFKDILWQDLYKSNEVEFKDAFRGYLRKDSFKDKLLEESRINKSPFIAINALKEKAQTIFGEVPITIPIVQNLDFSRLVEIEKDEIWNKKVIGKKDLDIGAIIEKLNINDWVNEGRNYIQENNTCPFCQEQTITKMFLEQLENYFDESYKQDLAAIKDLGEEYITVANNLQNLVEQIEEIEQKNTDTKIDLQSYSISVKALISQFILNKELVGQKKKEPSRAINLISNEGHLQTIQAIIANYNSKIKAHNEIARDYTNQKNSLISEIWKYLIETHRGTIEAFTRNIDGLDKGIHSLDEQIKDLTNKYSELKKKIRDANKNVTSIQPSVDEINRILNSFGFSNFKIVPSTTEANQYQIQREDGSVAEATLSEGETTFITFLYFLQLAKGSTQEDSITEERILIIDDPISSLDSTVLFVVSSLIKEIIKGIKAESSSIKQLVILTHNVYFHKEVSFVDQRTPRNGDTNFWILRKVKNVSTIQSYGINNPIQSSYELLWKELCETSKNGGVTVQNIMRRIIENYFKILGSYGHDDIIECFDTYEDKEVCRSLISWINDGSHGIPDDFYLEQQNPTIEKYLEIFKQVFIKTGHEEHYNMMSRKTTISPEETV